MSLPIMLPFKKESTTQAARIASLAYVVMMVLIGKGVIPFELASWIFFAETHDELRNNMLFATMALLGGAPSILGWRTKDRELPVGVTINDVEIKDGVENDKHL